MSKHLFAFLLSELNTARILCAECKAVVEMPLASLAALKATDGLLKCRFCGHDFNPLHKDASAILDFAIAAEKLRELNKFVDLEFVLPIGPSDNLPTEKK